MLSAVSLAGALLARASASLVHPASATALAAQPAGSMSGAASDATAGRDGEAVRERLNGLQDVLGSWPLLDWQARRLVAAAEGEAAPSPEFLVEGLSPEDAQTLAAWP